MTILQALEISAGGGWSHLVSWIPLQANDFQVCLQLWLFPELHSQYLITDWKFYQGDARGLLKCNLSKRILLTPSSMKAPSARSACAFYPSRPAHSFAFYLACLLIITTLDRALLVLWTFKIIPCGLLPILYYSPMTPRGKISPHRKMAVAMALYCLMGLPGCSTHYSIRVLRWF